MTTPDLTQRLHALPADRKAAFLQALRRHPERYDLHPLTAAQRRMWLHDRLRPGSPMYRVTFRIDLHGALEIPALTAAFDQVLARHQALRTLFVEIDGEPWQLVLPEAPAVTRLRVGDVAAPLPFDLDGAPRVRATLTAAGPDRWVLVLELHHIVCDGWSMGLIFDDLSLCYAGRDVGPAPRHVDMAAEPLDDELVRFWLTELDGAPPTITLPLDRPRPAIVDEDGDEFAFTWPASVANGVTKLAAELGATPFMVLLAAWEAVLRRYGPDPDFVVATPVAGRTALSADGVVGLFVNTLALRAEVDLATTFRALVRQVRDRAIAAFEHQHLPFDTLVDRLRPEHDPSRTPVAQVMFAVEDGWADRLSLPGIAVHCVEQSTGTATYDLTLTLTPRQREISGRLEYRTALFDRATAERMAGHVQTLLSAALAEPERQVWELPMLTDAEHRMITAWGTSKPSRSAERPVHELIAEIAPERIAVVCRGHRVTYGELGARANQIATLLHRNGITAERPVGVCLPTCPDAVAAFLGVLAAGGMYVPLNPELPAERIRYLLDNAGVDIVLARASTVALLPPSTTALALDELAIAPCPPPKVAVPPAAAAYLIYTSGSTGRPKGVVNTHRGLTNLAAAMRDLLALRPDDRVLQFHSTGFDVMVSDLVTALCAGAELHLVSRHDRVPGPDLVRALREHRITVADLPPIALQAMDPAAVPELRVLTVGGEACPVDVARAWASGREFYNSYGPTEASVTATSGRYTDGPTVPIGRPTAGSRIYLLDDRLRLVPAGVAGQLYIGGAGVGRGYLGRSALTAAAFVPDPFADVGQRMYRTGDLARWRPDGSLEFLGRADAQVQIRGHRVEPGEVEARLRECAGVARCAVVVREDRPGDKRLVGYLVAEPNADGPSTDALRAELLRTLPDYLVPTAFVEVPGLPMTPNGKLDHRALPAPSVHRPRLGTAFRPPRGEAEQTVAAVWRTVLGLNKIGADDNFFDLGGNSMLLVPVHTGLEAAMGVKVPAVELFRYPTVAQLARFLIEGESSARSTTTGNRRAAAMRARRVRVGQGER
ncbi:amino acid adenylation domain-containing protein [Nocardia sp. NBC_01499]|uniref:non-ribosomal peptide synthetase n=1 Tax=Nocardia sp. NBC_01499 TaxID=2903597 RepID=UPI00386D6BC3